MRSYFRRSSSSSRISSTGELSHVAWRACCSSRASSHLPRPFAALDRRDDFRSNILPHIDCIILSPGPGRPDRTEDFGFASQLVRESGNLPILGICLGHQGIASSLGGKVNFVPEILHGQKTKISHTGKGLFRGVPQGVEMVTYNSLTVDRTSSFMHAHLAGLMWIADRGASLQVFPMSSR
jgi:hypothetical protein